MNIGTESKQTMLTKDNFGKHISELRDFPIISTLGEDEIHIWQADLDLPSFQIQKNFEKLSIDEREKANSYYFEKDRNRYIARRGILRQILGNYLNEEPRRLEFRLEKNNKPVLESGNGNNAIHFNITHSNGVGLFALCRSGEIGVDLEWLGNHVDCEEIRKRFWSDRENKEWRLLSEGEKREAFFNVWTCKEAFLKARGEGLSRPLDTFDISLFPSDSSRLLAIDGDPVEAFQWQVHNFKTLSGYAAAFAVKSRMMDVKLGFWDNR